MDMSNARSQISKLPEEFKNNPEKKSEIIFLRGKPVLAVMDYDFYDSLMETLEVMSDKKTMQDFRKGLEDIKEGRTMGWNDFKGSLKV